MQLSFSLSLFLKNCNHFEQLSFPNVLEASFLSALVEGSFVRFHERAQGFGFALLYPPLCVRTNGEA